MVETSRFKITKKSLFTIVKIEPHEDPFMVETSRFKITKK